MAISSSIARRVPRASWLPALALAARVCGAAESLPGSAPAGPCLGALTGPPAELSVGLPAEERAPLFAPAPGRFRLCPDLGAAPVAFERPAPPPDAPPFRDPRAPLRGVRNADASNATRFWRGTLIITGTEIVSGAVLALMPKENTNWDGAPLARGGDNFRRAWTTWPVWDGDIPFHNWIGHPYAGAFYYNMIRSQGGTMAQSLAFSAFESFLWEYVLESWAEQPSIQDLIATPLLGAALGEAFHRASVSILRRGGGHLNFGQKVLVFFLNPSYVINNGYRPPE